MRGQVNKGGVDFFFFLGGGGGGGRVDFSKHNFTCTKGSGVVYNFTLRSGNL